MITIAVRLENECLKAIRIDGHARSENGGDDGICAAVSLLARSTAATLRNFDLVEVAGTAPAPGALEFKVRYSQGAALERVRGVTDLLMAGLHGVENDRPDLCSLQIVDNARR